MVAFKVLGFTALSLLRLSTALPEPHTGMVDNTNIRDVGVIYTKPNYQGKHEFIYQTKSKPDCLALYLPCLPIQPALAKT
jgi:hypothetical protein